MPQVKNAPQGLNSLLERVYSECMKNGYKDETKCSKAAWSAAEGAGWHKDKDGKWKKKSTDEIFDFFEKQQSTTVQSILLSKDRFKTKESAVTWLKVHKKKYDNIDETDQYWRARQRDPKDFKDFKTHEIDDGIKLVIGHLKASIGKTFGFKHKAEG